MQNLSISLILSFECIAELNEFHNPQKLIISPSNFDISSFGNFTFTSGLCDSRDGLDEGMTREGSIDSLGT